MDKVSIVLPVYNSEDYLDRCIKSIVTQNYDNIELIIINDGSTDNSWQIIEKYKEEYPNIIVAIDQKNMGVSKTRNKGIDYATGKYLMFIDNDDYFDNHYIDTFVESIKKDDLDIVIGGYKRPDSNNKIIAKVELIDEEYSKFIIVAAWAKIYKTEYIKKNKFYFLNSNIGEDINFTIPAVLSTNKIKIIPYVGYNWFYNDKSVSNTAHKNLKNELQFDLLLNTLYTELKTRDLINNKYVEYYFIKLICWFLLYTTRGSDFKLVKEALLSNFDWLKNNFPEFKRNKFVKPWLPKGESLFNKLSVYIVLNLYKCHLLKFFLYIYSKL